MAQTRWGGGQPGPGVNSTRRELRRVIDRSQLSPQAPLEGPGPGHSCMAKDLNPILELPPGGAMHSNAGEKSDRWGQGLLAQSWTSQSPAEKTEWRVKPPYKRPFLGPGAPEPQASPQTGAGSPWMFTTGPAGEGASPEQPLYNSNLQTHCLDSPDSPQTPRHLEVSS